jgi:hypothetical protein
VIVDTRIHMHSHIQMVKREREKEREREREKNVPVVPFRLSWVRLNDAENIFVSIQVHVQAQV